MGMVVMSKVFGDGVTFFTNNFFLRDFTDNLVPDQFAWPSMGKYTAGSTYQALCWGSERMEGLSAIWNSWVSRARFLHG
jgi:hypothetical protein